MTYQVRRVEARQWRQARDIRLAALADPVAPMAFLESLAEAAGQPDDFWRRRTAGAAAGGGERAAQVVIVQDGQWVGTVTGLLEEPGVPDIFGQPVARRQVHLVAVWLDPAHRGRGLIQRAIDAVGDWGRQRGAERTRLYVHADNSRAMAAYAKQGFAATGQAVDGPHGRELEMVLAASTVADADEPTTRSPHEVSPRPGRHVPSGQLAAPQGPGSADNWPLERDTLPPARGGSASRRRWRA